MSGHRRPVRAAIREDELPRACRMNAGADGSAKAIHLRSRAHLKLARWPVSKTSRPSWCRLRAAVSALPLMCSEKFVGRRSVCMSCRAPSTATPTQDQQDQIVTSVTIPRYTQIDVVNRTTKKQITTCHNAPSRSFSSNKARAPRSSLAPSHLPPPVTRRQPRFAPRLLLSTLLSHCALSPPRPAAVQAMKKSPRSVRPFLAPAPGSSCRLE